MPEFPIPSARILLVSQIQGGGATAPPCPPVRYAYVHTRNAFPNDSNSCNILLLLDIGHGAIAPWV